VLPVMKTIAIRSSSNVRSAVKTDLLLGSPPIWFVADLLHPIHVLAAKRFLSRPIRKSSILLPI